jgi:magnesium chelatase subunit I
LFEAARAYAAADNRLEVILPDISSVASMSLRMRRSEFINQYFINRELEDVELNKAIGSIFPENSETQEVLP